MITLLATLAFAAETPLVLAGSDWKYLDTGSAPAVDWMTVGYDDAGWAEGPAPLGYGIVDVVTAVDFGGDMLNRHVTTWFRHTFDVASVDTFEAFSVGTRRDDGAIVYLNGAEVYRANLPLVGVTDATLATRSVFGIEQDTFFDVAVAAGLVIEGENVLAVELHQQSRSSFDLVMDLKVSGWDGPTAVTRGPWLQQLTPEGALVRWRTDGPSEGVLWWGANIGDLDRSVNDGIVSFDHEIAVTDMPPASEVVYAVGSPAGVVEGDDVDHVFRTAPVPGSNRPVRIWVLGDSGTASTDAEDVRDAYLGMAPDPLETDVWLMLGDNAYGSGTETEYQAAVFDFFPDLLPQVPLWPAIGNHDGYTAFSDTQTGPYFELFSNPTAGESGGTPSGTEAYFSFDYANIHFVCLDSMHSDRTATGPMATWLEADLASVDADWLIAFWHHPPYSRGSHNSDIEDELVEMREVFVPMLEEHGVDLVMGGHSHSYERSWLIDGHYDLAASFDPTTMVLQDHDGARAGGGPYTKWPEGQEPHQGAIYMVAGSSGQRSGGPLDHPAMFVSLDELGSVILDVDGLSLDARFIDETGAVLDQFAIDKGTTTIVSIDGSRIAMEGETVTYTGLAFQSDGTEPPLYSWDWADGTADTVSNPASHSWATEGQYVATLTVTDDDGVDTTDEFVVFIDNAPPVIDQLEASPNAIEGTAVTLTGHAVDPAGDPLTYSWLVDGDIVEGDVVDYTFYDDGTYEVTLTVTDDAGRTAVGVLYVPVANASPVIDDVAVTDPYENTPVTLIALVHDPGWEDFLTYSWVLPDGTASVGPVLEATFLDDGVYPIFLQVTDDDGAFVQDTIQLVIENLAPLVVDPTWGGIPEEGGVVTFHATGTDPSPLDTVTIQWGFESTTTWVGGEDASHVFPDQGPWEVWIAALDDDGGIGFDSLDVTLDNLPAQVLQLKVPTSVGEGVAEPYEVVVIDPGVADVITVEWTFSDGGIERGAAVTHAVPREGTWQGTVDVRDDEGEGQSSSFEVVAHNVPPVFVSSPEGLRVEPRDRYTYKAEVLDVDPLTYALTGPQGASVSATGEVGWEAPREVGATGRFRLTATDTDGASATQEWSVVVTEEVAVPDRLSRRDAVPCGCGTSGPGLGWMMMIVACAAVTSRRSPAPAPWP